MRIRIAAGLLIALTGGVQAQIYEWFDENGARHFSDQEPVGVRYRIVGEDESRLSTYTPDPAPRRRTSATPNDAGSGTTRAGAANASVAERSEQVCRDYLERLDAVQQRLRAGYSEPRGNRLRAQRRALQNAYQRDCS